MKFWWMAWKYGARRVNIMPSLWPAIISTIVRSELSSPWTLVLPLLKTISGRATARAPNERKNDSELFLAQALVLLGSGCVRLMPGI